MSGSYRLQPPSPFPYSGGSRMEQALVPGLTGPNSSSMLGYALGAQLQRQADQMNYEQDMAEYNLTAQREAEQAREDAANLRREQLRNSILTSIINNPSGAAMVPESYNLVTPEQRALGNRALTAQTDLRVAQAQAAGRRGTGTSGRPDPYDLIDYRQQLGELNAAERRRAALDREFEAALRGVTNEVPSRQEAARKAIEERYAARRAEAAAEVARLREGITRPGTQRPAANQPAAPAPAPATTTPQAAPQQAAQVDPGSPAPRTTAPVAPAQRAAPSAELVDRARALGTPGFSGGVFGARKSDGTFVEVK